MRTPGDILQLNAELRALARERPRQRGIESENAQQIKPVGVRMVATLVGVAASSGPGNVGSLVLALQQNSRRKRIVIPNLDGSGFTIYFCYGKNPQALIPIQSGGILDESGSTICTDEIWVTTNSNNNQTVPVYEGIEDVAS